MSGGNDLQNHSAVMALGENTSSGEPARHVIEEGTEILGGVLLTRAGIVVDNTENPGAYQAVLEAVDRELPVDGPDHAIDVLSAVGRVVGRVMPYDTDEYRRLLKKEASARGEDYLGPEDRIGLSGFINVGGICHQQALLEATMVRLLQLRGDLGGSVSVVSGLPGPDHPDRHTKAVFTEDGLRFTLVGGDIGVMTDHMVPEA